MTDRRKKLFNLVLLQKTEANFKHFSLPAPTVLIIFHTCYIQMYKMQRSHLYGEQVNCVSEPSFVDDAIQAFSQKTTKRIAFSEKIKLKISIY